MTRFLLTLLALLTGLAAQTVPAQARMGAGAEVVVQLAESGSREVAARGVASRPCEAATGVLQLTGTRLPVQSVVTRTVLQGIDRARE
jgi:hypothetical protein